MIDTWIALAVVAAFVLTVDLVTTLLRKRARRIPAPLNSTEKETESDG